MAFSCCGVVQCCVYSDEALFSLFSLWCSERHLRTAAPGGAGLAGSLRSYSGVAFDHAEYVLPIAGVRQQCEMLVGAVLQRWRQNVRVLRCRLLLPRNWRTEYACDWRSGSLKGSPYFQLLDDDSWRRPTTGVDGPRRTRAHRRPTCREEVALAALRSVRRRSRAHRGALGFAPTAGGRRWPSCTIAAVAAAGHVLGRAN